MGDHRVSVTLKKRWKAESKGISLKEFAHTLVENDDGMAKEWFANKKGAREEKRSDKNIGRANMERIATKAARAKKKGGAKKDAAATTPAK